MSIVAEDSAAHTAVNMPCPCHAVLGCFAITHAQSPRHKGHAATGIFFFSTVIAFYLSSPFRSSSGSHQSFQLYPVPDTDNRSSPLATNPTALLHHRSLTVWTG